MREVMVDERLCEDETAFHGYLKGEFGFPEWYGGNLSALADCLGDVDEPTRFVMVPDVEEPSAWFARAVQVAGRAAGENDALEVLGGSAALAYERLKLGNLAFQHADHDAGEVSAELRKRLFEEGQHPKACIVACSDSRVVPEAIFSCGLGEIFCVRTAGNTVGPAELASIVYACEHLDVRLVVVMGHTDCGAVAAALEGPQEGAIAELAGRIAGAIGDEHDPEAASVANARAGVAQIAGCEELAPLMAPDSDEDALHVLPALYRTDTGAVEFM